MWFQIYSASGDMKNRYSLSLDLIWNKPSNWILCVRERGGKRSGILYCTGTSEGGFYGVLYRNVGSMRSTGSQVGGIRSTRIRTRKTSGTFSSRMLWRKQAGFWKFKICSCTILFFFFFTWKCNYATSKFEIRSTKIPLPFDVLFECFVHDCIQFLT